MYSQGAFLSFDIGINLEHLLEGIVCFCGIPTSLMVARGARKSIKIIIFLIHKDVHSIKIYLILELKF